MMSKPQGPQITTNVTNVIFLSCTLMGINRVNKKYVQ